MVRRTAEYGRDDRLLPLTDDSARPRGPALKVFAGVQSREQYRATQIPRFELQRQSLVSLIPVLEAVGRSAVGRLTLDSAVGEEINPRANVWVGFLR